MNTEHSDLELEHSYLELDLEESFKDVEDSLEMLLDKERLFSPLEMNETLVNHRESVNRMVNLASNAVNMQDAILLHYKDKYPKAVEIYISKMARHMTFF